MGETEDVMSFWSGLFVVGKEVSWESEKGGRIVKGWRIVRWQVGKGGKVVR